jgi:Kelch motif
MSTTGAASARSAPSMMWTGSELLVYERCGKSSDALYSPCDDRWRPLNWTRSSCALVTVEASPKVYLLGGTPAAATELDGASATSHNLSVAGMPTTTLPTAVATSTGVILWGGTTLLPNLAGNVASNAGAVYDRASDRWRAMSTAGAPSPRIAPGAWSSAGFVVWGGQSATSIPTDGGRFDCLNLSLPPCSLFQDGAIYDAAADKWMSMGTAGDLPSPRRDHLIAWAGDKILVWGGYGGMPFAFTRSGAFYDTKAKTWTKVPALPDSATVGPGFWTGSRLVMAEGGALQSWAYSPGASGWTAIPALTGVRDCSSPKLSHGALASICTSTSGASMVAALLEDGATAWTSHPVPDMQLQQPGVLWNGTELFVWGGNPPPSRDGCPPGMPCDPVLPPSVNSGQVMVP